MSMDPVSIIISIAGLITGSSSLIILGWKRYKKRFLMYDIFGFYDVKDSQVKGFSDLTAIIEVGFFNDSDETISVTDILGTLKYNKERYKRIISDLGVKGIKEVFSECPKNYEEVYGFNILPHETVKKKIIIEFQKVLLDDIDRIPVLKFLGLIDGKIPFFMHNEQEFKENWSDYPPTLLLTTHVNAKKEYRRYIQLYKRNQVRATGTFTVMDISRIENAYNDKFYPNK